MAYKIAIASSDGVNIDISFGSALKFYIYEVNGTQYQLAEQREYVSPETAKSEDTTAIAFNNNELSGCGSGNGCGNGASSSCGSGGGCGSAGGNFSKVELLSDCRCIVCKKIGFHVQKQLEKKTITGFDVNCSIEEALKKITVYLEKVDGHQSW